MQVTVNGWTVDIFQGATVADALRAWSAESLQAVRDGRRRVTDARGREVMLDGALSDNQALRVDEVGA